MAETPFEPFFDGGPGKGASRRAGAARARPYQRSFRCRASLRRPAEPSMERFAGFIALHEAISERPGVDLRRLWWCGLATAAGAAALAAAAVLVLRGMFGIAAPVFIGSGVTLGTATAAYAVCAAAATLQATALVHVLVATAARPIRAFSWIGAMVVVVITLLPFTLHAPMEAIVATAALNLAGGATVVAELALIAGISRDWDGSSRFGRYRGF